MAQLFATPVGRLEIILGKLLPYRRAGRAGGAAGEAVGGFVFSCAARATLVLLSLLFLIGMLDQGLLISVVTQNQMVL